MELKANVRARVREAKGKGREVYVMGESLGGIVALSVGMNDTEPAEMPDRLVLINSASCWDRPNCLIGNLSAKIIQLPEPFFTLCAFPAVFLILDRGLFSSDYYSGKIFDSEDRKAYGLRALPTLIKGLLFNLRGDNLKWRVKGWLFPGCEDVNSRLKDVKVPVLVVAGVADLLLPSQEEALRLNNEIPDCTVRLIKGAGHAGVVVDTRTNLLEMIQSWANG
eukprot:gnl/TRDRNA2_/TRDRNA2_77904_c0_seq1.p1 gnl/TRDRNA2_/TRDRNA2_77904_c0~~gnl/TRDRNA2_/TRDRNA2_77904_c0_seq1.p1  ORF type:complete len:235 (-),score=26.95 gnl/TRDRNA2_/TRDRNA2_77904_c0_seq1:113-778(-)